ncbi:MAG: DUF448 domain-containing protein [Deltaproteobacteria bacterium]|jgi:predicted RNA-binding protein YlxR (DUF448 family)|nr:DUF448 domain-containing protein [Deltaproteobacteria bacterium]
MCSERNGPVRTCIACRQAADKSELVRYVLSPLGELIVDYRQRLPGRGTYTCFKQQCLLDAVKRKAFQRAFRKDGEIVGSTTLQSQLLEAVEQKILNLLGMARKSGQIVSGTQAVLETLKRKPLPKLIVISEDISIAIGDKISKLAEKKNVDCAQLFNKLSLGHMLGKEERSAIAVEAGSLAKRLTHELHRYEQLVREI